MNKVKGMVAVSSLMLLMGGIAGCTSQKKAATHKEQTSQTTSVKQKKTVKKPAKKAGNQKVTQQAGTAKTETKAMDFAQIKQGAYQSLLGQWSEVAESGNRHDGQGNMWMKPTGHQLTITPTEIKNEGASFSGNTLVDQNGDEGTLSFKEEKNILSASTEIGAISWNFSFYPAGVAMTTKDWGPDLPQQIDTSKDRMVIWSSNNGFTQIFQKDATTAQQTTTNQNHGMDFAQIQAGNYDSLKGEWQNGKGKRLTVKAGQIDFTDVDEQGHAAKLMGLKLDIPTLDDGKGAPKMLPYFEGTVPAYDQKLAVEHNPAEVMSLRSGMPGAVLYISFLPQGVAGDLQDLSQSELQQEKIIAVETQNNATLVQKEDVYYRSK